MIITNSNVKNLARRIGYVTWGDAKHEFCNKYNIPDNRYLGIDLVSPDLNKIACVVTSQYIGWSDVATFLAYRSILPDSVEMLLFAIPNAEISEIVKKAMNEIVRDINIVVHHAILDYSSIEEWVNDNPPGDLSKNEYYARFSSSGVADIPIVDFSRIMVRLGYSTDHSSRTKRWKK